MKSIKTLIPDILSLFDPKVDVIPTEEQLSTFSDSLKNLVKKRLAEVKTKPYLRISNIGKPCSRELWYSINKPEVGEPLRPETYFKFLFGDVIEQLILLFARVSGHSVENEQKEVEVLGVKGSIDGTIDGELVDVKSASSLSFKKFEEGISDKNDSFGYRVQLGLYNYALGNEKPAHFIAVDKQHGKITLDTHSPLPPDSVPTLVELRKASLANSTPPERAYGDEKEGESGNRKLGLICSYCAFKKACWPGLRTFLYSRGPVFLTKVVREPNVPEA